MKMTRETTHHIFKLAKKVYSGELSLSDAANQVDQNQMAQSSARDYINNYKMMMLGREYQRAMNIYSTEYFLKQIRSETDQVSFKRALESCRKHFDFYDRTHGKKFSQPTLRKLVEELSRNSDFSGIEAIYPDEIKEPVKHIEGAKKTVTVNAYERSQKARLACLDAYGTSCEVCSIDFGQFYGSFGEGFIHVHHKKELSSISGPYQVDPIDDLIPVCPNCHAMLHKEKPAISIEELKQRIKLARDSQ